MQANEGSARTSWIERTHQLLNGTGQSARAVQAGIHWLILLNVTALVVETVEPVGAAYRGWFGALEAVSVAVFTLEYVARIASAPAVERFRQPISGRLRFLLTPMAVVDLVAILPFYLPWLGVDLRTLRAVRLLRLVLILKVGRYSRALQGLRAAIKSRKEELVLSVFVLGIVLVVSSSILYLAEREAQPAVFGSIPAAAWWGVATLTTVGYGDVIPVTLAGKLAAAGVAIVGIGVFALPASILASALVDQLKGRTSCPHCGKEI